MTASRLAPLLQRIFADADLRRQLQEYFEDDWFLGSAEGDRWLVLGSPRGWLARVFDVTTGAFIDDGDTEIPRFTMDPVSDRLYDAERDTFFVVDSLQLAEAA